MQSFTFNGWTVNFVANSHYFFDVLHPDGVFKGACYTRDEMLAVLSDIKKNGLNVKGGKNGIA